MIRVSSVGKNETCVEGPGRINCVQDCMFSGLKVQLLQVQTVSAGGWQYTLTGC